MVQKRAAQGEEAARAGSSGSRPPRAISAVACAQHAAAGSRADEQRIAWQQRFDIISQQHKRLHEFRCVRPATRHQCLPAAPIHVRAADAAESLSVTHAAPHLCAATKRAVSAARPLSTDAAIHGRPEPGRVRPAAAVLAAAPAPPAHALSPAAAHADTSAANVSQSIFHVFRLRLLQCCVCLCVCPHAAAARLLFFRVHHRRFHRFSAPLGISLSSAASQAAHISIHDNAAFISRARVGTAANVASARAAATAAAATAASSAGIAA